ncbi:MAG: C39 family peptidase [Pseudomonadota bacterium]
MRTPCLIFYTLCSMLLARSALAERPVRSLLETRQENVIIQRWDNSCAAAVMATILTYDMAFPVTEEQVARAMLQENDELRVRHRGGFSLLDMKRYARQVGFDGNGYSGMTLADLAALVPAIVPIRVRGYDHFVVVRQVNAKEVQIADPGFGNYKVKAPRFAANWAGIGFQVERRLGVEKNEDACRLGDVCAVRVRGVDGTECGAVAAPACGEGRGEPATSPANRGP